MKIEIGKNVNAIPLHDLKKGTLFAACVYNYENGDESEEIFVYMYSPSDEPYETNAITVFPESFRGSQMTFDCDEKVIPLCGTLEIEYLPKVSDFRE